MADTLFTHRRDMDRAALSDMLAKDDGAPKLEIKLSYWKDGRPRGLKVGIYRTLETSFGSSYDIMNKHNKTVHVAGLTRKPTAKVAAHWVKVVTGKLDAIAEIALASDNPDWNAIAALFEGEGV